jgi:hypothetical protein
MECVSMIWSRNRQNGLKLDDDDSESRLLFIPWWYVSIEDHGGMVSTVKTEDLGETPP